MQCEACGATLHENATVCPNCRAPVATPAAGNHDGVYEEETWRDAAERFLARNLTPRRAKLIIEAAVVIALLSVLLAWHPWNRPARPAPYSYPVPGLRR